MENKNSLYLTPPSDLTELLGVAEEAYKHFRCLPGRFAVLKPKARLTYGSLVIPDSLGARTRPDVGLVFRMGDGVELTSPGYVACRPYSGLQIDEFSMGGFSTEHTVHLYGPEYHQSSGHYVDEWYRIALLQYHLHLSKWLPTKNNLIVEPLPSKSPILLQNYQGDCYKVLESGSETYAVGDFVVIPKDAEMYDIHFSDFSMDVRVVCAADVIAGYRPE